MNIKNLFLVCLTSVIIFSCIDPPEDFIAPVWDVEVNVPLTSRSYTLEEAIESDTSITWITDQNDPNNGVLVFTDVSDLEKIEIEDNLTLDDFSTQTSEVIGSVKIDDVEPFNTFISVEQFAGISGGTSTIFPENRSSIRSEFSDIGEFVSIDLSKGQLELDFDNSLPVELQFEKIEIRRVSNNELILEVTENLPLVVQQGSSNSLNLDLSGKSFYDDLLADITVYTPGSNGQTVTIQNNAGFNIASSLSNLEITRAVAVLPEQDPFVESSSSVIDDSTFVETAIFESGSFEININNFIDLGIDVEISIENLVDPSGNSFNRNVSLARKETNSSIRITNLKDWKIQTTTPGIPTNEITYEAVINVKTANDPRELNADDSISVNVNFTNIVLSSVEGKLKPTSFEIDETSFDFDFGDFRDQFSMEGINIEQPSVVLNFTSTALIDIDLDVEMIGSNGTQSETLMLEGIRINGATNTKVDLIDYGIKDFLNSFTGQLPNEFSITGNAIANPNYTTGMVKSTDFVTGTVEVEIPLYMGLNGGTVKDTVDIDFGEVDKNDLDNVNNADLTIEVTNGIPATAKFTAFVLDNSGRVTLNVPPPQNSIDFISIARPNVDVNGNVISPATNTEVVNLSGDDIQKIIDGLKLGVNVEFETSSNGSNTPVKFKYTDKISFKITINGNYRTDFDNKD